MAEVVVVCLVMVEKENLAVGLESLALEEDSPAVLQQLTKKLVTRSDMHASRERERHQMPWPCISTITILSFVCAASVYSP